MCADAVTNLLSDDFDGELIVGLIAAVGTETTQVINLLEEQLSLCGYETDLIKISRDVIAELCVEDKLDEEPSSRINSYMSAGNNIRKLATEKKEDNIAGGDAVLAFGAAARIFDQRAKDAKGKTLPHEKKAFIVDSLKRPEEVEALRRIYPQGFVLIGVHADKERRKKYLTDTLDMNTESATKLMDRDADERVEEHGQRVNKTFHLADFFVQITENRDSLRGDIRRMVELWFGHPYHTPTFEEFAMFFAYSSALRSADLSRQVGAVIVRDKEILSTGANECPKSGGGQYWSERNKEQLIDDVEHGRDYKLGCDSNKKEQNTIIEEIVAKGIQTGFDEEKLRRLLSESKIKDLTEYGRVVHAEMEALLSCARRGIETTDAELFCTTFPCHNCAKHIIDAGIKRVVFVEPYEKSKALEFHSDSIVFRSGQSVSDDVEKVIFQPFVGIGPRRFYDLFSMSLSSGYEVLRKDDKGETIKWDKDEALRSRLRLQMKPSSYLELEAVASKRFKEILDSFNKQRD